MYKLFLKSFFDLFVVSIVLIFISPLFIIISLLNLVWNDGKLFFIQERVGKDLRIFKILKFKTMSDACNENGELLPEKFRLTKLGKFLRSWSLDELPQLFNILKGDMSLVGPRPLLPRYIPRYSAAQLKRHDVKPGITGLAQVKGRNALSWNEKFNFDLYYVEHQSFLLDIKILWNTIMIVLMRRGISSDNNVTMEEFMGNN